MGLDIAEMNMLHQGFIYEIVTKSYDQMYDVSQAKSYCEIVQNVPGRVTLDAFGL